MFQGHFSRSLRKSDLKTCIAALNHDFFLFDLFHLVTWDDLDLYYGHKAQEMILTDVCDIIHADSLALFALNIEILLANITKPEKSKIWEISGGPFGLPPPPPPAGRVTNQTPAGWGLTFRFLSRKSGTQIWLKQYPVDSTLTQMAINVSRLCLDSFGSERVKFDSWLMSRAQLCFIPDSQNTSPT